MDKVIETVALEEYAGYLEASNDYRVLRRLKMWHLDPLGAGEATFHGLYVDVETTGLDVDRDEVIEGCLYPFQFTGDGRLTDMGDPLHFYNQPRKPITDEITRITGITADTVRGHTFPIAEIKELVERQHLIVAHHAAFDRKMLERVDQCFAAKCWGCSMEQVPWKANGHESNRLGSLLTDLGRFYRKHTAVTDCLAGMFALTADVGGRRALAHLLDASRAAGHHVWALRAPFEAKDALKARGYFWNGGEDGRPKAWHKEVADGDAERLWLGQNVYNSLHCPARFDAVTAYNRFSKRG